MKTKPSPNQPQKRDATLKKCSECGQQTAHLKAHKREFHLSQQFRCQVCISAFKNELQLEQHTLKYHGNLAEKEKSVCPRCKKVFNLKAELASHMIMKHRKIICAICKKEARVNDSVEVANNAGKVKVCSTCFPLGNLLQGTKNEENTEMEETHVPEEKMDVQSCDGKVALVSEGNDTPADATEKVEMDVGQVEDYNDGQVEKKKGGNKRRRNQRKSAQDKLKLEKKEQVVVLAPQTTQKEFVEKKLKEFAEIYGSANVETLDPVIRFEQSDAWTVMYHSDETKFPEKFQVTKVPSDHSGSNAEYPEYITKIIEGFGKFYIELEEGNAIENLAMEPLEIDIVANCKKEVKVTVTNAKHAMFRKKLKQFEEKYRDSWSVDWLFHQTGPISTQIAGKRKLVEYIGDMQVVIDSTSLHKFDKARFFMQVIQSHLQPSLQDTVLDFGCKNGYRELFLSTQCAKVIGFGRSIEIGNAKRLMELSKLGNVMFHEMSINSYDDLLKKSQQWGNVAAIIEPFSPIAGFLTCSFGNTLRSIQSLNRLVLLLSWDHIDSPFLEFLIKPMGKLRNDQFYVKKNVQVEFNKETRFIIFLER